MVNVRHQTALLVLASMTVLAAACSSSNQGTPSSTTSPTSPPTVAAAALGGLLLSAEQVSTAMSTTGMTVTDNWDGMTRPMPGVPDECLPLQGTVEDKVYNNSGWNDIRGQYLNDPGPPEDGKHYVEQAVIFFPVAQYATDFFTASTQRWSACANRSYPSSPPNGTPENWSVGPISNTNGFLTASRTEADSNNWTCQRAFTVSRNVAIDVMTCSYNPSDPAAVNIAHQIAAKVANH